MNSMQEDYKSSMISMSNWVRKLAFQIHFNTEVRKDLVKLAVASARANRRQPYGSNVHGGKKKPMSGMKHSVEWWGKGRGVSRIMRRTGQRRAAQNPHTLGGRRAHGPKVEKDWSRKLNRTERRLARNSALLQQLMLKQFQQEDTDLQKKFLLYQSS